MDGLQPMKRHLSILIAFIVTLSTLGGCSQKPISAESFAMDTYNTITVYNKADEPAMRRCLALLDEYDKQWSAQRDDSPIYALNKTGQAILSGDTAELFQTAMRYASLTDGAFDPAIFPITSLWHITTRSEQEPLPSKADIKAACALVNYNDVKFNPVNAGISVTLKTGMGLDFGAIAKGFAGDKLKAYLLSQGVKDAIINLGGNVCLVGNKMRDVGLQDPRAEGIFGKLSVSDVNVITSGDYERYIEVNGQRIHHIFDPKTGYCTNNGVCSVTLIGKYGAQCDALSKPVFVLGVEKGLALIQKEGVDAVIVTTDGKVYLTEGAKKAFTLVNTAYRVQ